MHYLEPCTKLYIYIYIRIYIFARARGRLVRTHRYAHLYLHLDWLFPYVVTFPPTNCDISFNLRFDYITRARSSNSRVGSNRYLRRQSPPSRVAFAVRTYAGSRPTDKTNPQAEGWVSTDRSVVTALPSTTPRQVPKSSTDDSESRHRTFETHDRPLDAVPS